MTEIWKNTQANALTLRGMATVNYWAADVPAARAWYRDLLGIEPYFQRPNAEQPDYVEFRLGDYQHELGIVNRKYAPPSAAPGAGGTVLYWHVDDLDAMLAKVKSMGATEYQPVMKWGEAGFVTASVIDPFGNVLGLMFNPH